MIKNDKRFPVVTDIVVMLLLFLLVHVAVGAVLRALGFVVPDELPYDTTDIEHYMAQQVVRGERIALLYPLSMGFSILAVWAYIRFRGGRGLKIRHSASGFNPNIILSGTLWVLSAQVLLEPLSVMLSEGEGSSVGRGIWACVTALVAAPILEELLCRGVVLESVRRNWGSKVAVLVSALFFGLIHVEPATMVVAMVVGVILGVLYLRTSSLYSVIIIHSINNAAALALIYVGMGDESLYEVAGGGTAYYIIYAVAALLFVVLTAESMHLVFVRQRRVKKHKG